MTRSAISQYESDLGSPRPEVMSRIASVLNLPERFFTRAARPLALSPVFYRSLAAATKGARSRAERKIQWVAEELLPYLSKYVELPTPNIPRLDLPPDVETVPLADIEDLAAEVRHRWGLDDRPISNMTWLLEGQGVLVTRIGLDAETLDSMAFWIGDRPGIVVNAERCSAVRQRFDLAHELGHLILHRDVTGGRAMHPSVHRVLETQAHRFAGAFLLPESSFAEEIYAPTLGALRSLKTRWLVSIGVMIKRCSDLSIASEQDATRLWKQYGKAGWRRWEPLDDDLAAEEPSLQRQALETLVREGLLSRDDLRNDLPFRTTDIEELANLDAGFVGDQMPRIRLLDFRRPPAGT